MIEWGQKSKPKNIPEPKFNPQKIFPCRLFLAIKVSRKLKSSCPKKNLPKFSYPKKSQNRKFETPKNPLIIPVTWNPEYPLPPPPSGQLEARCWYLTFDCFDLLVKKMSVINFLGRSIVWQDKAQNRPCGKLYSSDGHSLLHSRFYWGGALRDDTKNGCVTD